MNRAGALKVLAERMVFARDFLHRCPDDPRRFHKEREVEALWYAVRTIAGIDEAQRLEADAQEVRRRRERRHFEKLEAGTGRMSPTELLGQVRAMTRDPLSMPQEQLREIRLLIDGWFDPPSPGSAPAVRPAVVRSVSPAGGGCSPSVPPAGAPNYANPYWPGDAA